MYYRLLLFIIIVTLLIYIIKKRDTEGFHIYDQVYCGDCGRQGRYKCSKCADCGYCITEYGHGECVPGDARGPYFRKDCSAWEYTRPVLARPYYRKTIRYWNPYRDRILGHRYRYRQH